MKALASFVSSVTGLAFALIFWAIVAIVVWWLAGVLGAQGLLVDLLGAAWAVLQSIGHQVADAARQAAAR